MSHHTLHPRSQRGFSMLLVIMAMLVTAMFVAAAYAGANGDLPLSGNAKDRKVTYAAAEAGLNFYSTHLNQDPDYWTHCANVPAPNATEKNPVTGVWSGSDVTRPWRNVTGAPSQYTIEILPANGNAACVEGNQDTVLDRNSGSFRIRVTGRPYPNSTLKRSIVASFKRKGFLDYLWFTDYEDQDYESLGNQNARTSAFNYCRDLYRWQRPASNPEGYSKCPEIQWVSGDVVDGPLHSNDSLLTCGAPQWGRVGYTDRIEVVPKLNGRVKDSGCTGDADIKGVWKTGVGKMKAPDNNQPLADIAAKTGKLFSGRTIIRLLGDNMTVTNDGVTSTMPIPANNVIYVKSDAGVCTTQYPADTDYTDGTACGNVYVSGTYNKNLTIAADVDVIIAPTAGGALNFSSGDQALTHPADKDVVLGLVANRFVRVAHRVNNRSYNSGGTLTGCANLAPAWGDAGLDVQAAVLALQHSWIVDNYGCGAALGDLNVTGAITQLYRGPVGSGKGATGFLKKYSYDQRFKYRSPPFFLNPVDAQWLPVRVNEQVPAH